MTKIHKISISLIILSFCLVIVLIKYSQRISINEDKGSGTVVTNSGMDTSSSSSAIENKSQEAEYVNNIEPVLEEFQEIINALDSMKNESVENEKSAALSGKSSDKLEEVTEKLENTNVPVKFKNFHLLFSRSLLRLSTYLNTSNQLDKSAGIELFKQAKSEFDSLISG